MEDNKRRVGLDPSVGYVTPVGSEPGEGLVLRNSLSPHELVAKPIDGEYANAYQLFTRGGLLLRPTEPCFGSRVREDGRVGSYEWQTYTQVSARVDSVAAALWHLSLVPRAGDGKRFLGFFLKNCRDWMVCALAAYKTNVVVVPMYDTLGPETVGYIQRQTTMPTVLCTATELKAPQPLFEPALPLVWRDEHGHDSRGTRDGLLLGIPSSSQAFPSLQGSALGRRNRLRHRPHLWQIRPAELTRDRTRE